jgi:hypothetical protein
LPSLLPLPSSTIRYWKTRGRQVLKANDLNYTGNLSQYYPVGLL